MIQTIINEPLVLISNSSPIVFDATNIRTRCAFCCKCKCWKNNRYQEIKEGI